MPPFQGFEEIICAFSEGLHPSLLYFGLSGLAC